MKKVLSVATAAILAVSMLAGCGGNDNDISAGGTELLPELGAAQQGKPSHVTTPRSNYVQYPYGDGEGVKLTYWMAVPPNVSNNPDTKDSVQMTQWARLWQEKTGIEVEFIGPTSDTEAQFNEMTAVGGGSGKLPDIIEWEWTSSYSGGPAKAEADGVLVWLDDYITPDGPGADLWQYLQDNPTLDQAVRTDDGHYYCFPFIRGDAYLQTTSGPIVRKDIIEAAGFSLDDMITIDDWTKVLTAVKEQGLVNVDVQGRTKMITTQSWANLEQLCLGAYNVRAGMYVDYETGTVKYGNMEDGYKEWLKQMVAWVDAGILDCDIVDYGPGGDSKARQANMLTPKEVSELPYSVITYGAGGGQIGTWNASARKDPGTYGAGYELTGIQFPLLKAGSEIHYSGGSTDYAIGSKGHAVITADCGHPEAAAAFLNFCYSQQGHEVINFGVEGVDYTKNSDGTITYGDWIMKNPEGLSIACAMANRGRANMNGAFVQDPNYIIAYWATEQQQRALHMWNDETDVQMTIMPPVTLTDSESRQYSQIMKDVETAAAEYRSAVFKGEKEIDGTWDEFMEELNGLGISDAIAIEQAALDRYNDR